MVNLTGITLSNSRPRTAIFHIIPKFYQRKALFLLWSTFSHNFFVILQQHLPISASMSFE